MKTKIFRSIFLFGFIFGLYIFINSRIITSEIRSVKPFLPVRESAISKLENREMPSETNNSLFAPPEIKQEMLEPQKQKDIIVVPAIPFLYSGIVNVQNEIHLVLLYQAKIIVMKFGDQIADFKLLNIEYIQNSIKISFLHVPTKTNQYIIVNNDK